MLTAAELVDLQAAQNELMPGTAVIQRFALVSDGMGGYDQNWANVGTVRCRLYPQTLRSMNENPNGGMQMISETRWFVTMPVGTNITAKDRVLISGRTFEIYQVNNTESFQTAVRAEVIAFNEENRSL